MRTIFPNDHQRMVMPISWLWCGRAFENAHLSFHDVSRCSFIDSIKSVLWHHNKREGKIGTSTNLEDDLHTCCVCPPHFTSHRITSNFPLVVCTQFSFTLNWTYQKWFMDFFLRWLFKLSYLTPIHRIGQKCFPLLIVLFSSRRKKKNKRKFMDDKSKCSFSWIYASAAAGNQVKASVWPMVAVRLPTCKSINRQY